MDVATFLADLAASRVRAQAAGRGGFDRPPDLQLPLAIEVALTHRFLISPILARSAYAPDSARAGVPSSQREDIEYWWARYGAEVNWLLDTGASGVVALEIDLQLAQQALAPLAGDEWSWQRSLHFVVRQTWHILFTHVPGLSMPAEFPGLRLQTRTSILIPPSRTPAGIEMVYADPDAPLLSAGWLRDALLRG